MTIAAYRVRQGGRYPLTLTDVRLRKPELGLPAVLTQDEYNLLGVDPVEAVNPPALQDRQALSEGPPEKVGTAWRQTWIVETLPVYQPTSEDVNAERDRRMVAGFDFQGIRFQSRPEDRENIMGAFALASTALTVGGKQPGDLRWHGGESDFVFIAEDNSRVPMDAIAVLGLGQAAAAQKSALTFAANDLKKVDPVPADFDNDQWWP